MEHTYLYYAFISYKREDSRYAKWLQRKLHNYRLPARLRKQPIGQRISLNGEETVPKHLSPIYRDKTDLIPGALDENLANALSKSKYLIVICSRNAREHSVHLDQEIRAFLDSGHSPGQIIPLIIDPGVARPEKECFPPELEKLNDHAELLGANIGDSGKNDAFLKIVAYMLGVQMAEIKSLDKIRRRRNAAAASVAAAAVAALAIFSGVYWWEHIAVHTEYYESYVLTDNVAEGISPIKEADLADYSRYYRFTVRDGKVREVEYLNYAGVLCPPEATVFNEGAARFEYSYTEGSILYTTKFYSYNGELIICYQFSENGERITLLQDGTSGETGYSYTSVSEIGERFADRMAISRYVQTFDEDGRITARYFAYGESYALCANEDFIFGYAFTYDEQGNVVQMEYIGTADGDLTGSVDDIGAVAWTYDENGKILSTEYLDAYGSPIEGDEGWAYREYVRDTSHNVSSAAYYDADYEPVLCADGYASVVYTYDGAAIAAEAYYDLDGEPVLCVDGYASARYEYDEEGRIVCETYWDEEGNPTIHAQDGTYGYTWEFVSDTELIRTWTDADGEPMENAEGYAIMHFYADELGYPIEVFYYGADQELCTEHYASCTYVYEEAYHRVAEWRFFDEDGNAVIGELDCAALVTEYDSAGRFVSYSFYGTDGSPYEGDRGYAAAEITYESMGDLTSETYFFYDDEGNASYDSIFGMPGAQAVYDESGRLTEFFYLGEDGEPEVNEESGWAGYVNAYDEYDRICSVTYYNAQLVPVLVDGAAKIEMVHDEYGNTLSVSFYGADGEDFVPMVYEPMGVAAIQYEYDEKGRETYTAYYGAEEDEFVLMVNETAGCAIQRTEYTYDEENDWTTETTSCYNEEDEPMFNEVYGCAAYYIMRDASGNILSAAYYDYDEESESYVPLTHAEYGYYEAYYFYDEDGNFDGAIYRDADGNSVS